MDSEVYSINWNEHCTYVVEVFGRFWEEGALVDCTIAAEGKHLKAHRLMLSACSPYFERLFRQEMDKDKGLVLEDITFEDLKSLIELVYKGHVTVPKERIGAFVRAAELLQIKVPSLQREVTEMSDMSGKKGLASHLSHKRMRCSVVGVETSEFQCENLKTSSIGRKKSADEKCFTSLQTELLEENVSPLLHSILVSGSRREAAGVFADIEPSVEPKEEVDMEDSRISESEGENASRKRNIFSSAVAGSENRNELTSVSGSVSSSYGSTTSSLILGNKLKSSLSVSSSVTASIPSSANTASSSPFVPSIPTAQRGGATEDSFSCEQRELAEQRVGVEDEPVVKVEVIPAVFSEHSECTMEPLHEVWVKEEIRSSEDEEETIGTDLAVICSQEMENEDQDVAAASDSSLYYPAMSPRLTFTASSSTVAAEGEIKEVNVQDVKGEKPEVNEYCMGQGCKGIEVNDSTVDKMVESAQHVVVETTEETESDSAVEQIETLEEEVLGPLSDVSKMLGKEYQTSSRSPYVFHSVSDVQVLVKKQQKKRRCHECEVCKARFGGKNDLTRHMKIHTGERPFECEDCGKSFKQKAQLTKHKVTHTGERPFQCEMCDRSFGMRESLIRHMRTHTGERPFECDVCGSSFSQGIHLTAHKRTHTGERPFQCNICKRSFTEKGSLNRHLRTHPGERS